MFRATIILGAVLALSAGAAAADDAARVPVRVVGHRLVARCDLSTPARRIPVHMFIDFENPCALELHSQAVRSLRVRAQEPITVHVPGFQFRSSRWGLADEKILDDFTKYHASALGEVACVGTIGAGVLRRFHVVFDLHSAAMFLSKKRAETAERPDPEDGVVVDIDIANDIVWLPVRLPDGKPASFALGSASYDTILDETIARRLGKPAGDVGAVKLETIDFARYVAFRPTELPAAHRDGAAGVTGVNLLKHFRVEIDRVNRYAVFRETVPAAFPTIDLAYFKAMASGRSEPLEAFLGEHIDVRLSPEAADLLLERRLEQDDTPADAFERALGFVNGTRPKELRTSHALEVMKMLNDQGRHDLVIRMGELGLKTGRDDRDPNAVHKIHGRLGEIQLERGERKLAWRHLLSAAFGTPEDGRVNLNLGRFYEKEERYARAFSRYVQAVIAKDSGPEALQGLARVQKKMGKGEAMSARLIERLIAGKVPGFGAADKFRATKENATNRCVLAELFTSAESRRAIASDLGWDGVRDHFPRENVAVLVYHVGAPTPLVNPASSLIARQRGIRRIPFAVFNGRVRIGCGGREHQKEQNYLAFKEAILGALTVPSKYTMTAQASVKDGVVSGAVDVKGPAMDNLFVTVLLVEKGVVYPGRSKIVVHHLVVRGLLAGGAEGVPFKATDGAMRIPFERELEELRELAIMHLGDIAKRGGGMVAMDPPAFDPSNLSVVAYLRDGSTGIILQAVQVDPAAQAGEDTGGE